MSTLASPLTLRSGLALPNRLAKAAMTEALAADDGTPGEALRRVYERWSRGGVGLSITGNVMVDARYLERCGNVIFDSRTDLDAVREWARAAKVGGNALLAQISHPGRQTNRFVAPEPVAPSAVPAVNVMKAFGRPRALAEGEIEDIVGRFARAARIAEEAGFDGVQLHGAHGYLVSQFLSPLTNQRTDRWGGSLENRARFLLEIVRAVRGATSFTVAVKLNSADFQRGGFDEGDSMRVVEMLDAAGIDLLEISGGSYESLALLGYDDTGRPSSRAREGYFLEYARKVRARTKLPLMLTGGMRTRDAMSRAIDEGAIDVVGVARPLCVDPELPRRLLAGEVERAPSVSSPRVGLAMLEAMGESAWYGAQIARMGAGLDPEPAMGVRGAAVRYLAHDALNGPRRRRLGHARA